MNNDHRVNKNYSEYMDNLIDGIIEANKINSLNDRILTIRNLLEIIEIINKKFPPVTNQFDCSFPNVKINSIEALPVD